MGCTEAAPICVDSSSGKEGESGAKGDACVVCVKLFLHYDNYHNLGCHAEFPRCRLPRNRDPETPKAGTQCCTADGEECTPAGPRAESDRVLFLQHETSGVESNVLRIELDGLGASPPTTIANKIGECGPIAVDNRNKRLYYSDDAAGWFGSCDFDGGNKVELGYLEATGLAIDERNSKVCWTEESNLLLKSADLDGGNSQVVFDFSTVTFEGGRTTAPVGPAIDAAQLYITTADGKLLRSSLTGHSLDVVLSGVDEIGGAGLAIGGDRVFFANTNLYSSNLDGSNFTTLFASGKVRGVTVDQTRVYWTTGSEIRSAKYDGMDEKIVTLGYQYPQQLAIAV